MNDPILSRLTCFSVCVVLLSLICVQPLSAQFSTEPISAENAQQEVNDNSGAVGFTSVYFNHRDLRQLLNHPQAVAVRLYTAKASTESSPTLIATSIDGQGQELGTYFRANGVFSESISQSEAQNQVVNVVNGQTDGFTVSINRSDMDNLMSDPSTTGINFKPGNHEGNSTLILAPSILDEMGTQEMTMQQIKSSAPCPDACGNGNYLTSFE